MFAVVCVLLAALGHSVMSGTAVPGWMLLTAGAATTAGAWCVAGRERGPLLVGLLTVGTQAALHSAFSLGQAMAGSGRGQLPLVRRWADSLLCGADGLPVSGGDTAEMLRLMHRQMAAVPGMSDGTHDMAGMPGMAGMAHPGSVAHGSAAGMLAAHLLVALLSAWWLWGGERAAFRLVRSVSARLFAPLALVLRSVLPDAPPAVRAARQEPRRAVRTLLLAHAMSLRGPPHEPAVR